MSSVDLTRLADKLGSYMSDNYKDASVTNVDVRVAKAPQIVIIDGVISSIVIKDVTVTYENIKTDYFSQITTDYEIVFPEKANINIVDDSSDILLSFKDYSASSAAASSVASSAVSSAAPESDLVLKYSSIAFCISSCAS